MSFSHNVILLTQYMTTLYTCNTCIAYVYEFTLLHSYVYASTLH